MVTCQADIQPFPSRSPSSWYFGPEKDISLFAGTGKGGDEAEA